MIPSLSVSLTHPDSLTVVSDPDNVPSSTAKTAPQENSMQTINKSERIILNIFPIVVRKVRKSTENYSLRSASIGLIFAALYAGYIPKNRPIPIEKEIARII